MYIGLQVAFVGALHPAELKNGWAQLSFQEAAGPFAGLAIAVGAGWLATLLYVDAAVSPGGTGLLYSASSSRVLFAMARHRYVPSVFGILSERSVPIVSIIFSFLVGCAVFLPFPGWQQLVGFITAGAAMGYATVPLAFGALRRQEPDHPRPFRLPAGEVLAPIAFIAANLLIYWAGWTVIWKLFVAIALGFALLAVAQATNRSARSLEWRGASWLWPYLTGMAVISYLGAFGGGLGVIPFGWDVVVVSVFSMAIYALAISVRLAPEEVRRHVAEAREEAEEELAV
jgi:amino acid transporter